MAVFDNLKRAKSLSKMPLVVSSQTNGCQYNGIDFLVVESNGSLTYISVGSIRHLTNNGLNRFKRWGNLVKLSKNIWDF
jgi:hypothetical protein